MGCRAGAARAILAGLASLALAGCYSFAPLSKIDEERLAALQPSEVPLTLVLRPEFSDYFALASDDRHEYLLGPTLAVMTRRFLARAFPDLQVVELEAEEEATVSGERWLVTPEVAGFRASYAARRQTLELALSAELRRPGGSPAWLSSDSHESSHRFLYFYESEFRINGILNELLQQAIADLVGQVLRYVSGRAGPEAALLRDDAQPRLGRRHGLALGIEQLGLRVDFPLRLLDHPSPRREPPRLRRSPVAHLQVRVHGDPLFGQAHDRHQAGGRVQHGGQHAARHGSDPVEEVGARGVGHLQGLGLPVDRRDPGIDQLSVGRVAVHVAPHGSPARDPGYRPGS